jgi:tetratricopeptide (TPR) repeat protein
MSFCPMHRRQLFPAVIALTLALGMFPAHSSGADDVAPADADDTAQRAERVQKSAPKIQIQSGYLGRWFTEEDDETRILLLRVSVQNRHKEPITVARSAWNVTTEGRDLPAISMPSGLSGVSIAIDGDRVALDSVKTVTLQLDAGQKSSTWLVFKNIPDGDRLPEIMLACSLPEFSKVELDVDQTFADRLKLKSRRTGPADAIALLTIDGSLDTVNVGTLAREIDQISAKQVCRVIVEFGQNAKAPDRNVASWLRQTAVQSGRSQVVNNNFPSLPSSVIDFHYVTYQAAPRARSVPNPDAVQRWPVPANISFNGTSRNVHDHLAAAVDSAVAPLCEVLPREELLKAIRQGDAFTTAAVLRHGAERLVDGNLPLILSMTKAGDPDVANAAIFALRSSGSPTAINALVGFAMFEVTSVSDKDARSAANERRIAAVQSLAASRYATAHSEVLRLLSSEDPVLRTTTAQAIAANPRPTWSAALAALFLKVDESRQVELLPALAAVGHPRLLTILGQCLASKEPRLSSAALDLLIARPEPTAEQLSSEWMLKHLETTSPSTQVLSFLRRTRDHRAVRLLLRHLENKSVDRHDLLTTVLTIGDHRVAEQIAADFSAYDTGEQLLILKALAEVHSKLFWTLTSSIVSRLKTSNDKSLEGVVSLLQKSESDRAVRLLIELLSRLVADKDRSSRHLAVVCAALASSGTPDARDALRDVVRNSESGAATAKLSLSQLYQRSPAMRYVSRGASELQARKRISMAILYLDAAVKTDPELPAARLWRGNAALHINRPSAEQLEQAQADFARYVDLEPDESEGHTGLALVLVRLGRIDEGIAAGMAISEKAADDSVYFYNMACVYGRAIEQLKSHPDGAKPEQQSQIELYRLQGVKLLQQSIDNGLDDSNLDWMQRDPDLETIRKSPAFTELVEKTLGGDLEDPDTQKPEKTQ